MISLEKSISKSNNLIFPNVTRSQQLTGILEIPYLSEGVDPRRAINC